MKKTSILGVILPMLAAFPQESNAATTYRFILDEYTGDDSQLVVDIYNMNTPTVTFDVYTPSGTTADIRAVYFNWAGTLTFPTSPVSGTDVTDWDLSGNEMVYKMKDSDTNMHGGGSYSFDGGVQIGNSGAAPGDDYQSTTFTLTANENIAIDAVGARLTSVMLANGSRDGSSKLFSDDGFLVVQTVPEPGTLTMIGVGLGLAGVVRSRKKFSEA